MSIECPLCDIYMYIPVAFLMGRRLLMYSIVDRKKSRFTLIAKVIGDIIPFATNNGCLRSRMVTKNKHTPGR